MATGDRFVEVKLSDWKELVQRSYRGLKPKLKVDPKSREYVIDLHFSEHVGVRVFTSIPRGSEVAAGIGADAIRVMLYFPQLERPAKKGKSITIKRTKNWRDTFKRHMHDLEDEFEDKESYWESRAQGLSMSTQQQEPPRFNPQDEPDIGVGDEDAAAQPAVTTQPARPATPAPADRPTDKQLNYIRFLLSRTSWPRILNHPNARYLPAVLKDLFDPSLQEVLDLLDKRSASTVIDIAKEVGGGSRYASDSDESSDGSPDWQD